MHIALLSKGYEGAVAILANTLPEKGAISWYTANYEEICRECPTAPAIANIDSAVMRMSNLDKVRTNMQSYPDLVGMIALDESFRRTFEASFWDSDEISKTLSTEELQRLVGKLLEELTS